MTKKQKKLSDVAPIFRGSIFDGVLVEETSEKISYVKLDWDFKDCKSETNEEGNITKWNGIEIQ